MTLCCFFFQAEDGIRDWSVTGVQTCALPISKQRHYVLSNTRARWTFLSVGVALLAGVRVARLVAVSWRSEERRVGKECRIRKTWSRRIRNLVTGGRK